MVVRPLLLFNIIVYLGFLSTLLYILFPDNFMIKNTISHSKSVQEDSEEDAWNLAKKNIPKLSKTKKDYHNGKTMSDMKTYGELNAFMCTHQRKLPDIERPKVKRKRCPGANGIVTVYPGGRIGNSMWEYSGVVALSWITGLKAFVPHCLKYRLDPIFDGLKLPTLETIAHCPFNFNQTVNSLVNYTSTTQSIIVPQFRFLSSLVIPRIYKIRREFVFKRELKQKAQQTLKSLAKTNQDTFVAVHVRRTDYINFLQDRFQQGPVTKDFFIKAMKHFKSKYHNCLFVFISDDPKWCYEEFGNLPDVAVPSYNTTSTADEDLALMVACNHTIFDYGTFGEWGALLAGGEVVFSRSRIEHSGLKNWKRLS